MKARGYQFLKLVGTSGALVSGVPLLAQTAVMLQNNDNTGFDVASTRTGVFVQDRNVSVRNRPHPGYDPVPYKVSSFFLNPSLTADLDYNDNLLASGRDIRSSGVATLEPLIAAQSDWSSSSLQGIASANIEKHTSHAEEDRNQWLFGTRGRYDIDSSTSIQAGGAVERRAEPRTATTAPITDRPIAYNRDSAFLGATKDFNRVRLLAFGTFERLDYLNSTLDGVFVGQHYRNRSTFAFNGQAEYSIAPGYNFVLTAVLDNRNATASDLFNPKRDSNGVDVQAGASFDIGGLATGTLTAGYLRRKYRLATYPSVSGVTFSAGVDYYATPLITVRFLLARDVEDATVIHSSGFLNTIGSLHADYEFERNIILTAGGSIAQENYKGIDRKDDRKTADLNVRWILNRSVEAGLHYAFINQKSHGLEQGRTFTQNVIGMSLTYHGSL